MLDNQLYLLHGLLNLFFDSFLSYQTMECQKTTPTRKPLDLGMLLDLLDLLSGLFSITIGVLALGVFPRGPVDSVVDLRIPLRILPGRPVDLVVNLRITFGVLPWRPVDAIIDIRVALRILPWSSVDLVVDLGVALGDFYS